METNKKDNLKIKKRLSPKREEDENHR
jgi:hypothetical protein